MTFNKYWIMSLLIFGCTVHASVNRILQAQKIQNGAGLFTIPSTGTDTFALLNASQVLTNKTMDATLNTFTNIPASAIAAGAGIPYSKLNLTGGILNADINAAAGIVYSKLNLSNSILNADVNSSAAIAYSKLALSNSILNADVNSSAAIAYSKLALSNSIVNADINSSAAIARSKIASGTANQVIINDGSGNLSGVSPGSNGNILQSNGTIWSSATNPSPKIVSVIFAGNVGATAACTADPCTVVTQSGEVSSVNRTGAGAYTINITGGTCSTLPVCNLNGDPNFSGNIGLYNVQASSTTAVFITEVNSVGAAADGLISANCRCTP